MEWGRKHVGLAWVVAVDIHVAASMSIFLLVAALGMDPLQVSDELLAAGFPGFANIEHGALLKAAFVIASLVIPAIYLWAFACTVVGILWKGSKASH